MGIGGGPKRFTIQFILDVLLKNLTKANEEEIKEQLIAILEASGAKGPFDFEEFESGSTIVNVTSSAEIPYDTVVANITAINAIQTLELTDADGVKQTTIIGYVDGVALDYENDLIMVVNKEKIYYYTATDGGTEITQAIVNTKLNLHNVDKNTIQSVIFGGNTIKVGDKAFAFCTSLTTIYFGEVKTIGGDAFVSCTSLATIDFKVVTSIGNSAFADCTSLANIDFKVVNSIGIGAFIACTSLATIDFGVVTSIGVDAFDSCEALTNIDFKEVKTIGVRAFRNCTSLTTIDFGVMNSIGGSAFNGCEALATIDFKVVITIGDAAFRNCTSLTELDFKEVKTIEDNAFNGCKALTELDFREVITIRQAAFYECTSLTELDLKKVNFIGPLVWQGCTSLATVKLNVLPRSGGIWQIQNSTFDKTDVVTDSKGTFLVATVIQNIEFDVANGDFSKFSTSTLSFFSRGLELVTYDDDPTYKQVKTL
jgi:hypothetical protein